MNRALVLILVAILLSQGMVYAQDQSEPSKNTNISSAPLTPPQPITPQNLKPIEFQQTGTDKKPSEDLYYQGRQLQNYEQIKAVIDPLNDPEASRLLKTAAGQKSLSDVFDIAGGLLVVGGVVYYATASGTSKTTANNAPFPVPLTTTTYTPPDTTLAWVMGGAGGALAIIGLILEGNASQNLHGAVIRYNHLVAPDKNLSMMLMPQMNLPGLVFIQRF